MAFLSSRVRSENTTKKERILGSYVERMPEISFLENTLRIDAKI